ncbi:unnamed protein product [Amoebophrya sp. A120]|nr:unnamed protein product [Amoebophrya sp. A120]|eukprot:GSA120T00001874001.1
MPLTEFFDKMEELRRMRAPLLPDEKSNMEKIFLSKARLHPRTGKPAVHKTELELLRTEFRQELDLDKRLLFEKYAEVLKLNQVDLIEKIKSGAGGLVDIPSSAPDHERGYGTKTGADNYRIKGELHDDIEVRVPELLANDRVPEDSATREMESIALFNAEQFNSASLLNNSSRNEESTTASGTAQLPNYSKFDAATTPGAASGTMADQDLSNDQNNFGEEGPILGQDHGETGGGQELVHKRPTLSRKSSLQIVNPQKDLDHQMEISHPQNTMATLREASIRDADALYEMVSDGRVNGVDLLYELSLLKIKEINKNCDHPEERNLLSVESFFDSSVNLLPDWRKRNEKKIQLLMISLYLLASPAFYCAYDLEGVCKPPEEDGVGGSGYLKSIYFVSATLSTVGFGDVTPASDGAKVFTILYIFVGLALILGVIIDVLAEALESYGLQLEKVEKIKRKNMLKEKQNKKKGLHSFDAKHSVNNEHSVHDPVAAPPSSPPLQHDVESGAKPVVDASGIPTKREQAMTARERALLEKERLEEQMFFRIENSWASVAYRKLTHVVLGILPDSLERWLDAKLIGTGQLERELSFVVYRKLFETFLMIVIPAVFGAIVVGSIEGWNALDSLYWAVIAVTTVGYGDKSLENWLSRSFCVFYLLISTAMVSAALGNLASMHMLKQKKRREFEFEQRKLTPEMMAEMDTDGNGVDQFEFCLATLVAMEKLSREDLQPILEKFHELDHDKSGVLTKQDLLLAAEGEGDVETADVVMLHHEHNAAAKATGMGMQSSPGGGPRGPGGSSGGPGMKMP